MIWSESGVAPEEVALEAEETGIKIVGGPRELKELLGEAAEG